jgi:predicted metalloprotease
MVGRMIRLDNCFVFKEKSKYYLTDVVNISVWRKMSDSEKKKRKESDVTEKVKRLLKKHKTKSNIHIKTKPSKKKIKTKKLNKKKLVIGGNGGG